MKIKSKLSLACASSALLFATTTNAIVIYAGPPGTTTSGFASGVSVETFNADGIGFTTPSPNPAQRQLYSTPQVYSGNVGTYTPNTRMETARFTSEGFDLSGDGSRFFGVRFDDNQAVLTLNPHATNPNGMHNYFGFHWIAADPFNRLTLRNSITNQQFIWTSANVLSEIGAAGQGNTLFAINGTEYDSDDYYGSPFSGFNTAEIYAFLHFYTEFYFDTVIFDQGPQFRFESDNHTIMLGARLDPDDSWVVVPEPSTYAAAFGILALLFAIRRRRK
ncbi:MAG: PEP-CTERM sorting domain-containing protein [Opitutales bacterium]|nr:PEP-CTERM sorting domain-containing protein [Opitutales bacterium]